MIQIWGMFVGSPYWAWHTLLNCSGSHTNRHARTAVNWLKATTLIRENITGSSRPMIPATSAEIQKEFFSQLIFSTLGPFMGCGFTLW
jgi:hypothetical protein